MDFIIRDFQAIQEAKLRVKGFTLVLGESSSGKSACLRAMYAATHNRFRNGQVRHGEDHATIMVKNEDSSEIFTAIRPWSGSIKMKLGNEVFNKIGRTLPKQINDFLNFGTLDVAGDNYSLHFHDQFQKPLLLEYSQKKVMDVLSASKGIDDLMLVKDKLSEVRAENKGAFKVVDGMLAASNAQLSEVKKFISDMEPFMAPLNEKYEAVKVVDVVGLDVDKLTDLLNRVNSIVKTEELLRRKIALLEDLEGINGEFDRINDLSNSESTLNNIAVKVELLGRFILSAPKSIELGSNIESCLQLAQSYKESERISDRCNSLVSKIEALLSVIKVDEELSKLSFDIDNLENLTFTLESYGYLKKRYDELKNIVDNGLCPVCHSKVE